MTLWIEGSGLGFVGWPHAASPFTEFWALANDQDAVDALWA
jgi:hypothetical protein